MMLWTLQAFLYELPFPKHFTDAPFIAERFKKELTSLFRPVPEVNK